MKDLKALFEEAYTFISEIRVTLTGPPGVVGELRARVLGLAKEDGGRAESGIVNFPIVEEPVLEEDGLKALAAWLELHAEEVSAHGLEGEIWINVLFNSSGSQWIQVSHSLVELISATGCELNVQFVQAIPDGELRAIIEARELGL